MQHQSEACTSHLKSSNKYSLHERSLEKVFHKSNEDKFYTASIDFLKKRLHEKTCKIPTEAQNSSQSCCNLTTPDHGIASDVNKKRHLEIESDLDSTKAIGTSLSMHQVLPFPKSNKEGFLARLKNTFQKYRPLCDTGGSKADEIDTFKPISNFKFPRCQRLSANLHSSCLVEIYEEKSDENLYTNTESDNRDTFEDISKILTPINR